HLEIGRNEPTASTIIAYAKFFNISADELLGISDSMEQNAGNVMHAARSSDETRLLDIYRTLSPDMRQTLWSLLETWTPTISNKNKA
ncbi:MAG: helix-turn-helix domain-containing protein, partial [Clostridia bacterium]|nr:helix-turn-helix domain-containing protein [Clostridia bacterium]